MAEEIASNKRIAKNTLIMYFRMIFMMFIGFYTSRVILNALGISDLGLSNVAGSAVGMFVFMNDTLTSGTQRFISFAIGEGDTVKLKKTFECAFSLHVMLAGLIFLLCETVGLWYVCNKLVVEPGRFNAALWCYQLATLSVCIGVIQVPFRSALVAHEKLGVYAYMTIFDAVARLLAAYLIQIVPWDRLIFNSTLGFFISFIPIFIYNSYCRKHFGECSFKFGIDKTIFKGMISFSGWNTLGALVGTGRGAGVNLVLNFFCGTAVNGARGIAGHANGWVLQFVDNFLIALNPQIIKTYAAGDIYQMNNLIINGAKLGCYLLLFLGIPLFIEIELVINLWLGQCPEYVVDFMRISMLEALFITMGKPTVIAMHATGQMKVLNLTLAPITLSVLPICYIMFKYGFSPSVVLLACVTPWIIVPIVRVLLLKKYTKGKFPVSDYFIQVMFKTIILGIIMFSIPYFVKIHYVNTNDLWEFITVCITSVLSSLTILYMLGMDQKTRAMVISFLRNLYNKNKKKENKNENIKHIEKNL